MNSGMGGLSNSLPTDTREKEAELALKMLGYESNQIRFLNLPFYKFKKPIGKDDYNVLANLYKEIRSNHVFVCSDKDPNGTNEKCYRVIYHTPEFIQKNNQ